MMIIKCLDKKDGAFLLSHLFMLLNCMMCFTKAYELFLIPISYLFITLAFILYFYSGALKNPIKDKVILSELLLLIYLFLGYLIHGEITSLRGSMCLSSTAMFLFFSAFYKKDLKSEDIFFFLMKFTAVVMSINSLLNLLYVPLTGKSYFMMQGYMTHRNHLGGFALLGCFSSFSLIGQYGKKGNLLVLFMAIFNALTIVIASSRTPMVALMMFLFVIMIYFFIYRFSKRMKIICSVLFISLALLFVFLIVGRSFIEFGPSYYASSSFDTLMDKLTSQRWTLWKNAVSLSKAHPFIGASGAEYKEVIMRVYGKNNNSHNTYLELAAVNGLPSLALYLFSLFITIYYNIKNILFSEDRKEKWYNYLTLAILLGFMVSDFFEVFALKSYFPTFFLQFVLISLIVRKNQTLASLRQ